jgi:hypothetical protein
MTRKTSLILFMILATLLAGCRPAVAPPPPSPTPTPAIALPALDEEAVRALIQYEAELLVTKQIDQLMSLWAPDGYVADARHTPDNTDDDLTWKGQFAVRDRYITLVFPGDPQFAQPEILSIELAGDRAVATSTTRIGKEVSPAGDRWTFRKLPAGWRIESLTYNLEAK